MTEELGPKDLGAAWREQPAEKRPVNLEQSVNRRTQELHSSTRSEILMSVGAALFFVAVIAWRFASVQQHVPQLGIAAAIAWVLITLYWFRNRIWRTNAPSGGDLALTGLEHYRTELERRRDHLTNAWLWLGPLFLACMVLAAIVIGTTFPGLGRLRNALPLVVLLAVWTGFGIRRRRRQASDIQREIEELDSLSGSGE